jgi:hypothetical protein
MRVVRTEEDVTSHHRRGEQTVAETTQHAWMWITTLGCVCQLDLAPFDTLIWPHLVFASFFPFWP